MEQLSEYLPYIALFLVSFVGIAIIYSRNELNTFARQTVAAVYRVGIHAASVLKDEGIEWLRSDEGIKYRQFLARTAYASLPERLGPIPVGLVRLWVSEAQFVELVEAAFEEIVELADQLELPDELPVA